MKLLSIKKASYPHKFEATFDDGTNTFFGHSDYQDFTQHHSKVRRLLYRKRHEADLRTNDPRRAGFLSYYLLWGDSISLEKNIESFQKRFNL